MFEEKCRSLERFCFFNSRTAIAGAIIGLLLVFYNSKNLNCIGALSFFTTRRWVLKKSFFKSILLEWFVKREMIWSNFGAEQKWIADRKESGFCSYRCFWESEKLMVKKFSLREWSFFVHVRLLKSSFLQLLLVMRFDYDIVLVLGLFW